MEKFITKNGKEFDLKPSELVTEVEHSFSWATWVEIDNLKAGIKYELTLEAKNDSEFFGKTETEDGQKDKFKKMVLALTKHKLDSGLEIKENGHTTFIITLSDVPALVSLLKI